ncbi:hypothetical protein [Psilogramma increta granulovirus]|uniref:Uncharacterized protein n=1 Tax=Psilogramma increta granulovirus TaxID=2953508 RepID=A0A977TNN3_9BBAC|nr:hypothetical protein [Psilogramma increta granulovirus]
MLSIYYNNNQNQVFYNFDDVLRLMLQFNMDQVDKKTLNVECLKIVMANEQCYMTDGSNTTIRLITYDECYVSFEGVLQLIDNNHGGYKYDIEHVLIVCTSKVVLNPNHKWVSVYFARLKTHINNSFDFYFKILKQYMLANQPNSNEIVNIVNKLVSKAEKYKISNNFALLMETCVCYDKASALMLEQLKNV